MAIIPRRNKEGLQWCGRCKQWLVPSVFHKASSWCKACRSNYFKEHYNAEKTRKKNFLYYYGQGYEVYERFFALQGGKCAICQAPAEMRKVGRKKTEVPYLNLDHDHKTGKPRGLLCTRCNMVLGWMRDDPQVAERVRNYLNDEGKWFV